MPIRGIALNDLIVCTAVPISISFRHSINGPIYATAEFGPNDKIFGLLIEEKERSFVVISSGIRFTIPMPLTSGGILS